MRVETLNGAGMWAADSHSVVCPFAVSATGVAPIRILDGDYELVPTTVRGRVKTEFYV